MLTPQDVRSVQFEKNLRGYRTEDVDRFLDKVEQQLGQDAEQMEALRKQVADLTAENETLRRNMQSYEADGDMLKSALINAQRMGENVIREANQKAEDILHRANLRGDDIISIPLEVEEIIRIGVITHKDYRPTALGQMYLDILHRVVGDMQGE